MGFGVGLILTAVGAILAWAVKGSPSRVNIHTVGYILLVVGTGDTYVDEAPPARRRRRVIDEDLV